LRFKKGLWVCFFWIVFIGRTYANTGVLIKNTKVNDLLLEKGTQVIILSDSSNAYKIKYGRFSFLIKKDCIMKTSKQVKDKNGNFSKKQVATQGYLRRDINLRVNGNLISLKKGSKLALYDFTGTHYKIKDSKGILFELEESLVSFTPIFTNQDYSEHQALQEKQKGMIISAVSRLGIPYVWGGTSPRGYDCSGFTQAVYKDNGLFIPKYSQTQATRGVTVSDYSKLKIGDLIFFDGNGRLNIDHVGMYIGEGKFIHASGSAGSVVIETLSQSNLFPKHVVVIKRILDEKYLNL